MSAYCKNTIRLACVLGFVHSSMFVYAAQQPVAKPTTIADYDRLISYYRYLKPDSALYFAEQAEKLAMRTKDDNGHALILNQMGMINDNLGKTDESREKYLAAKKLYEGTGNKKGIATENVRLGVIDLRKGNYDKAMVYFLESLKVSGEANNTSGKMEAYLTIGECYLGEKKYDVALQNLKTAEQIDNTLPFSNLSLNLYVDMGLLYGAKGDYSTAISYFQKGISLSDKPQYQGLNITLTNYLATVYAKQGFKDKSIALQKIALAKSRQIHNYIRELQTLTSLAETYGTDDPAAALGYLKQALYLVKARGAEKQQIDILGRMADMYHLQHNDALAFTAKEQQHAIADKYYYQKMAKQISGLQQAYELKQSMADIQALKYENTRERFKQRVILLIAGAVVLLLLAMVLFYRRTQKLNAMLNSANTELKGSNEVKDKLFSVLAHDLRGPLASIISLLSLMKDDDLNADERKQLINMVAVSSNASLDILNNLLRWGEMQIKGIRINTVKAEPHQIIERNLAMLSAAAELKGLVIQNQVSEKIKVIADADHVEFVIRNLLSNAIKFTGDGGQVTISAEADSLAGEVRFKVADSGIGIASDRLQSIFSMSNVSTEGTKQEKGTSLGLVLCKEFIEANHGHIWAESIPGKGSAFMFTLKKA